MVSYVLLISLTLVISTSASVTPFGHARKLDLSRGAKALSTGYKFPSESKTFNYNTKQRGNSVPQQAKDDGGVVKQSVEKNQGKYIGYKCPMGANSNGNGLAIIHADPYDCSKYYYCVWGVEKISQCPSFLLWNDRDKACDWFWNVDCENRGRRSLIHF